MIITRLNRVVCAGILVAWVSAGTANAVNIATVSVGNPGNAGDTRYPDTVDGVPSFGSVDYAYNIGTYEVTAGQYTEFLNAVAKTDTYGLYNTNMSNTSSGSGITRGGSSGSYSYSVAADFANRPVNYVSWGDSARFSNWLHNGQPTGAQGLATTEDGSYYINGAISHDDLLAVTRKAIATWVIPSEDEWYKAAYYKGGSTNAGYWDFPTRSNSLPGRDMADVTGNNANYNNAAGPYPIDSGKYTTVVGEFQNSASPYGTFDQGGNVWEWNEAILFDAIRDYRGGSFGIPQGPDGMLASSYLEGDYLTFETSYLGFRLVEVPEPASAVLMGLSGLLLTVRRKRR